MLLDGYDYREGDGEEEGEGASSGAIGANDQAGVITGEGVAGGEDEVELVLSMEEAAAACPGCSEDAMVEASSRGEETRGSKNRSRNGSSIALNKSQPG